MQILAADYPFIYGLLSVFLAPDAIIIHVFVDCNLFIHIFMQKHASIVERLHFLMDGRDKYPWGQAIGLGKGTIDGMTRGGSTPGGDTLSVIARYENARVDWILDGRGTPYNISCVTSDEDAAELLDELLGQNPMWRPTVLTDGKRVALLLDAAASYQVKDGKEEDGTARFREVRYFAIEVIVGAIGALTIELVKGHSLPDHVALVRTSPENMKQITRGNVGTWRLLNAPDAIVQREEYIGANDPFLAQFNHQEAYPTSPDEAILLDHYRAMAPPDRSAVNQIVTTMAQYRDSATVKTDNAPPSTRTKSL